MKKTVIEATNLWKSYVVGNQKVDILKGINLTIEKGSFYSIMEPSGSGKSTLLYLLGGLDKPSQGSIKLNGKEMANMKDRKESKMSRILFLQMSQ